MRVTFFESEKPSIVTSPEPSDFFDDFDASGTFAAMTSAGPISDHAPPYARQTRWVGNPGIFEPGTTHCRLASRLPDVVGPCGVAGVVTEVHRMWLVLPHCDVWAPARLLRQDKCRAEDLFSACLTALSLLIMHVLSALLFILCILSTQSICRCNLAQNPVYFLLEQQCVALWDKSWI